MNSSERHQTFEAPVALCAEQHRHHGFIRSTSTMKTPNLFAPITLAEFADISRCYPILFFNEDAVFPVAIVGQVRRGQQIFSPVASGANAYLPAVYQLYPFMLEKLPDQDAGILLFDSSAGQVVPLEQNAAALPLFDEAGQPTNLLHQLAGFAAQIHEGRRRASLFAEALRNKGLLTPSLVEFSQPSKHGQRRSHLYTISEPTFRALSSNTVYDWFLSGFLEATQLALLSQRHWQNYQ
ncbi:hypothetical protein FHW20_003519 [Ochrobactrum intermedium]|uniref:SapC family protein n=1 Tax=Brucella intermedia TaxID=94625 RepID=A0ABR6ASW3_9HYPH|nr:SapC family protein [Brucella intermedia]MBA8852556.1 hypothetical protein [Brucella intermedia]NYD80276.1 hypothetical protein [Brucella intermedia]